MWIGTSRLGHISLLSVLALAAAGLAPSVANAADDAVTTVSAFPSATSTVVGSTGFIDDDEVGYFWSASRGDSVTESLPGPKKIKRAILDVDVVTNGLAAGAHTDWNLLIDGTVVGSFVVNSGFVGTIHVDEKFAKKKKSPYDVSIKMTNEVASGEGAITLAYAGAHAHSIDLRKN
jgi:hypothetical protein